MPGGDTHLDDDFLRANEFLIVLLGSAMCEGFRPHANALDTDAMQALESVAKSWQAQTSGIIYEPAVVNPIAVDMYTAVKARIEDITKRILEADPSKPLPEHVVPGVVTFLQRVGFGLNNGRPRCKAFLVFLSQFYVDMKQAEAEEASDDEPTVIL